MQTKQCTGRPIIRLCVEGALTLTKPLRGAQILCAAHPYHSVAARLCYSPDSLTIRTRVTATSELRGWLTEVCEDCLFGAKINVTQGKFTAAVTLTCLLVPGCRVGPHPAPMLYLGITRPAPLTVARRS